MNAPVRTLPEQSMWRSIRELRKMARIYRAEGSFDDVRRIYQYIRFILTRIRIVRECYDNSIRTEG
jgi:hypothetical protein